MTHARTLARQRRAWLSSHGYAEDRAAGRWRHPGGDVLEWEAVVTTGERGWPALRDWIARQTRDFPCAGRVGT